MRISSGGRGNGTRVIALLCCAALPAIGGCSGGSSAPSFSSKSDTFDSKWGVSASARVVHNGPIPKGGGHYKLGRAYQVGGRWYVPRHDPSYDNVGVGSWYGKEFHGRKTANGEVFDMDALTAAHPTLPMPSYAYVTNMRSGRTILVRINDRGPYVANREIDLSRASAKALGYFDGGLAKVRVRWAGHAPLNGDDRREQAFLRNQPWKGGGDRIARSDDWQRQEPRYEPARYAPEPRREHDDRFGSRYPKPEPQERYTASDDRQDRYAGRQLEPLPWSRSDAPSARPQDRGPDTGYGTGRQLTALDERPAATPPQPSRWREAYRAEPEPAPRADDLWSPFDHRTSVRPRR